MQDINKAKRELMENAVRTAVYDATIVVSAEVGFAGLRMQHIAKEAGLATGTLYNYFKNKDDLLFYVHEKLFEDFFSQICRIASFKSSADRKIIQVIRTYFEFVRENLDIFSFLVEADIFDRTQKATSSRHDLRCIGVFEDILREGLEKGMFNDIDPCRTAELFHGCIIGILKTKMERDCLQPDQDSEDLVKLFSYYLGIKV